MHVASIYENACHLLSIEKDIIFIIVVFSTTFQLIDSSAFRYVSTNPSGYEQNETQDQLFKQIPADLNSEFSFS